MFVLEPRDRAMARGAPIYAELLGFGMSADANDITAIDPDGAARAMRAALTDAKLNAEEIDYVNAHGTGTALNDKGETVALHKAFGESADASGGFVEQRRARPQFGRRRCARTCGDGIGAAPPDHSADRQF